jgi:hypothetical protein
VPALPANAEPISADPESPPADASSRNGKGNGDNAAWAAALIAGVPVGTLIGMGIGNATRKRMDRWSPCY